jgi:hypothetical protein
VRAPGLRVELCWPIRDPETAKNKNDNDVDLHVARLQGNPNGDGKHGWFTTANPQANSGSQPNTDDCYYSPNSACSNRIPGGKDANTWTPKWYANELTPEPGGVGVCHGWGSRRFDGTTPFTQPARPCTSPRLDRDNIACDPSIEDPSSPEQDPGQQGDVASNFCGPENINIDGNIPVGDRFAVGVQCYNCVKGNNGEATAQPAQPRVNIYCDGDYVQGFGYDPQKPAGADQSPSLWTEGQTYNGSMWQVGVVTWNGSGTDKPCTFAPSSAGPEWKKDDWHKASDGSEFTCVNNGPLDSGGASYAPPQPSSIDWRFQSDGMYPAKPDDLCPY